MTLELTALQKRLVISLADSDYRSPKETLALLLAEGFRFLYFDKETYKQPNITPEESVELILKELEEGFKND